MNGAPPANLRDAHLHLAEHGESLSMLQLGACGSVDEVLRLVAAAAGATPRARAWVRGVGLRAAELKEGRFPNARELDDASGGRPVLLRSFDHHSLAASTAVLRAAGIDATVPDPAGGVIERRDGEPTGTLLEHACDAVWKVMPQPSDEEYRGFVERGLADLGHRGFVEVHDMLSRPRLARCLVQLEREGHLGMRVELYAPPENFDEVREIVSGRADARVALGGLKLFADGTLNSRTAFMLEPFADPLPGRPRGEQLLTREQIAGGIARARAAGCRVAVHAIGDAAVRTVLDAEQVSRAPGRSEHRQEAGATRIEHAQFVDPADVPRFAALGVVASMQPCHLLTDIEAIARSTPGREDRAFPVRALCDAYAAAGMDPAHRVWLGSDAPVVPPEPMDNVRGAAWRARGRAAAPVGASQRISEADVWRLMHAPMRT